MHSCNGVFRGTDPHLTHSRSQKGGRIMPALPMARVGEALRTEGTKTRLAGWGLELHSALGGGGNRLPVPLGWWGWAGESGNYLPSRLWRGIRPINAGSDPRGTYPMMAANSSRALPQKSLHQSRRPGSLPQNHQVTLGESSLRPQPSHLKWGPFSAYCWMRWRGQGGPRWATG